MMDFIFVPLVVGVVTLGIYKFFELLVCRRERRMIIDKMDGNALIDYLKFVPMGVRIGAPVSVRPVSGGVSGTLKAGCLLLGIGFGLLFAFMLLNWCAYDASYEMRSIVYGGSVLCFVCCSFKIYRERMFTFVSTSSFSFTKALRICCSAASLSPFAS